jgi:hypothetical protein
MIVNKYKIVNSNLSKKINVALDMNWDFLDREDTLIKYEGNILPDILGNPVDYEVERFVKKTVIEGIESGFTYNLNFKNATSNTWTLSYLESNRFTFKEVYENQPKFRKSFFKFDFYDTTNNLRRKNYLTIILNKRNNKIPYLIQNPERTVELDIPSYTLNYNRNQEGFFIYWFKDPTVLNIDTLYMTCKFFDANTGQFTVFTSENQNESTNPNQLPDNFFYRQVNFDYNNYTYTITPVNEIDNILTNIDWYEYINP